MYRDPNNSCYYCGLNNHRTRDCRKKNNHIKRIDKIDGQLTKIYSTHPRSGNRRTIEFSFKPQNKSVDTKIINTKKPCTNKAPEQKPKHRHEEITFLGEVKTNKTKPTPQSTKSFTRVDKPIIKTSKTNPAPEKNVQLPRGIIPNPKYLKCMECLKWELRLQEEMKIVQILTKENLQLQKEKRALEREKNAWKILYEENNISKN